VQYAGSPRHREPAGGSEPSVEGGAMAILTVVLLDHAALLQGAGHWALLGDATVDHIPHGVAADASKAAVC
jgi:hypothetical protein